MTKARDSARPRFLVIVMRRLGDVLLATPLIHALREAEPFAAIDALVFEGTQGVLDGNPDVDRVITLPQNPAALTVIALLPSLLRKYDVAFSTQTGDRPTFLAFVAGRRRIGLIGPWREGGWWKKYMLTDHVRTEFGCHRVVELLRLAERLGIAGEARMVCPSGPSASLAPGTPSGRYAVLHPKPMYRYKRWINEGWRSLAAALVARGLDVVVTGSSEPAERSYLDSIWIGAAASVRRLDGRLDWPQLAKLIGGAQVYVGVDTSMTHLAAATGCPTIAIYGPETPQMIGPWPVAGLAEPWAPAGTIQNRGNVWVVQNPLPCLPCRQMGCERHLESYSRCLDELSARQVLIAVDAALSTQRVSLRTATQAHPPVALD
jgi:heptosyltransferase III